MIQRLTFAFGVCLLGLCIAAASVRDGFAQQSNVVALFIGNEAYPDPEAALKEPVRDVRALRDEFARRCIDADVGENLTKDGIQLALDRFYGKIKPGSTAIIFFSGIAIQANRENVHDPDQCADLERSRHQPGRL